MLGKERIYQHQQSTSLLKLVLLVCNNFCIFIPYVLARILLECITTEYRYKMQILDLVGGIDIGTDSRAGGLQNIGGAERGGGHDATSLKPSILFQSRELQPSLRIYG